MYCFNAILSLYMRIANGPCQLHSTVRKSPTANNSGLYQYFNCDARGEFLEYLMRRHKTLNCSKMYFHGGQF